MLSKTLMPKLLLIVITLTCVNVSNAASNSQLIHITLGGYYEKYSDCKQCWQREKLKTLLLSNLQDTKQVKLHITIQPSIEDVLEQNLPFVNKFNYKCPDADPLCLQRKPQAQSTTYYDVWSKESIFDLVDKGKMKTIIPAFLPDDPLTTYNETQQHQQDIKVALSQAACTNDMRNVYAISKINPKRFEQRLRHYLYYLHDNILAKAAGKISIESISLFDQINTACQNADIVPVPQGFKEQSYSNYLQSADCQYNQTNCFAHINREHFLNRIADQALSSSNVYAQLMRKLIKVTNEQEISAYFSTTTLAAFKDNLHETHADTDYDTEYTDNITQTIHPAYFYEQMSNIAYGDKNLLEYIKTK